MATEAQIRKRRKQRKRDQEWEKEYHKIYSALFAPPSGPVVSYRETEEGRVRCGGGFRRLLVAGNASQ